MVKVLPFWSNSWWRGTEWWRRSARRGPCRSSASSGSPPWCFASSSAWTGPCLVHTLCKFSNQFLSFKWKRSYLPNVLLYFSSSPPNSFRSRQFVTWSSSCLTSPQMLSVANRARSEIRKDSFSLSFWIFFQTDHDQGGEQPHLVSLLNRPETENSLDIVSNQYTFLSALSTQIAS